MDKSLQRCRSAFAKIDWPGLFMLFILQCHLMLSNSYDNWSSFSQMLLRGDAYSKYCTAQEQKGPSIADGRCANQRLYVSKLLPIIRCSNFIFSSIAGLCYDRFGSFITGSMGISFVMLSWIFYGFTIDVDACVVIASIFLGASVDTLNFPSMVIKYRFPNACNLVMALLGASASIGSMLPIIINFILERTGFTFRSVILTYAFSLFPLDWILISLVFFKLKSNCVGQIEDEPIAKDSINISLWKCLKSVEFFTISFFFFVVNLTLTYHQYFINETYKSDSITVKILEYAFAASFIPCVILGILIEKYGITCILFSLNFFGLLVPILSLYPTEFNGVIISLCIMIIFSMFTSSVWCYVQLKFPKEHFGVINGIIFTLGGCAALSCHPLFELCVTKSSRFIVNIIMIIVRSACFLPLFYIYRRETHTRATNDE